MFSLKRLFIFQCLITLCLCQDDTNTTETVISNAAFQEVAPCPCDLTLGSCDIGCCCDVECSSNMKETFTCIPGLEGGFDAPVKDFSCRSDHYNKADWFPLLCIEWEYNALLGFFYEWRLKLGDNFQLFLSKMSEVSFFSYRETETRRIDDVRQDDSVGYRYAISVKTGKPNTATPSTLDRSGVMALPQPVLSGQCLSVAPVQFLKDLDTSCTSRMSIDLCSDSSVLSSLFYIQAPATGTVQYFSVLGEDRGTSIAETAVTYYCTTDLTSYVKSTQGSTSVTTPTLFDYTLPAADCQDTCGNDICIDVNNLTNPDQPASPTLPPVCQGLTVPPRPSYNTVTTRCDNAVVDVDYQITWEGRKIVRLDAKLILGSVPVSSTVELTQKYKVTFTHSELNTSVITSDPSDNFDGVNTTYKRSGRTGYEVGEEIFSGSAVYNTAVDPPEFQYVNTNSTRQMATYQTGVDGLCFNAGRRTIKFAEDVTTSCNVYLDLQQFSDCSLLRRLLINRLNAMMPSDKLGRRGLNDPLNQGYWTDVFREELNLTCVASEYYPVGLSPVDNITGICWNITNGIHLDIMYGESGRSNGFSIYEILGSKVSYSTTTWRVACSGADSSVCRDAGVQPFLITSSVRFIKIPANTPEAVTTYDAVPREDDPELCPRDRCWANLFYPLNNHYTADSHDYVFSMVLLSILFFLGYLLITRPWW